MKARGSGGGGGAAAAADGEGFFEEGDATFEVGLSVRRVTCDV